MFGHIRDVSEDPNSLVFVLIDEVESLAHARTQALSGKYENQTQYFINEVVEIDIINYFPSFKKMSKCDKIDLGFGNSWARS